MRRDPVGVLRQMCDVCQSPTLKCSLKRWLFAAAYSTPERDSHIWHKVTNILESQLPKPTADWEFELLSIFSSRSVEEVRAAFDESGGHDDSSTRSGGSDFANGDVLSGRDGEECAAVD